MKGIFCVLILLCGTAVFATSVPPVDDPDTADNESHAVISVSVPAADASKLLALASEATSLPQLPPIQLVFRSTSTYLRHHFALYLLSSQLLFTFLI